MFQAMIMIAASLVAFAQADTCNLPTCPDGETCYSGSPEAIACMNSMPFNKEWATATVDTISQSLENFGFLALMHNSGPPYLTQVDLLKELAEIKLGIDSGAFGSDMDFQDRIQDLITVTHDAHTRYQKPVCYNAIFVQPFAFDVRITENESGVADEPKAFLQRNLYTDKYLELFPDSPVSSLLDQEVSLLNNLEFTTEVSGWADTHETRSNNRGVRFNTAVRSYLYRSAIQYNVRPLDDLILTMADGSSAIFPWLAAYEAGFANSTFCAAEDTSLESGRGSTPSQPGVNRTHHPELLDPPTPLAKDVLMKINARSAEAQREEIVPADSPYQVSCFTQKVSGSAEVQSVLVMKIASFAPPGVDGTKGFLESMQKCQSADYDMMVIDVMANGGGNVCLGLRSLELLVEDYWNDHKLVQMNYDMPHSPLMDQYIEQVNENDEYLNKDTQELYPDGKAYYWGRSVTMGGQTHERSNYFCLDCSSLEKLPLGYTPKKFMPADRLILITDGQCGSTCSNFAKIPQETGHATIVGAGGLWEEGMDGECTVYRFLCCFYCIIDVVYSVCFCFCSLSSCFVCRRIRLKPRCSC